MGEGEGSQFSERPVLGKKAHKWELRIWVIYSLDL
jgi:hypothetical protein